MNEITGRRTTLLPGKARDYERIHASIPETVRVALAECGVVSWQIWRDGSSLFHSIETTNGYDNMVASISARGPIDSSWDATIADLLDPAPDADTLLRLVWSMDSTSQRSGHVS